MPTTEERVDDLEALITQALEIARHHADEHSQAGQDPAILKQRQIIGWSSIVEATSSLTLTTSNQDVTGATITLPHIGVYRVTGEFDFEFTTVPASAGVTAALGVLTDSDDAEVDTPRAAIKAEPTLSATQGSRGTLPQQWDVTTTSIDTVYKLRARKSRNVGGEVIKVLGETHTTIGAIYIGRAVA